MKVIEYAGNWVLPEEIWQEGKEQTIVAAQAGPTAVWTPQQNRPGMPHSISSGEEHDLF